MENEIKEYKNDKIFNQDDHNKINLLKRSKIEKWLQQVNMIGDFLKDICLKNVLLDEYF